MSGCVGLAVGTFGTFESGKEVGSRFSETREMLFSARGAPDSVESHGRCETLIYQNGWSWSGVGAFPGVHSGPAARSVGLRRREALPPRRMHRRKGLRIRWNHGNARVHVWRQPVRVSRPGVSIATRGARPPCPGAS